MSIKFLLLYFLILLFSFRFIDAQDKNNEVLYPNQQKIYFSNEGFFARNIKDLQHAGLFWPGGKNAFKPLLYQFHIIVSGTQGSKYKIVDNTLKELQPGKLFDDCTASNPNLKSNRIYKLRKNWELIPFGEERDRFEKDYNEWPVEDGAPWEDVDGDGIYSRGVDKPLIYGDEMAWYVSNDMNTSYFLPDNVGLEIQSTIFGYDRTTLLGDVVFVKEKIINKGDTLKDAYFTLTSHSEIGKPDDDNCGIDTTINMAYCYNGVPNDEFWNPSPAVGLILLQGSKQITNRFEDSAFYNNSWHTGVKDLGATSFYTVDPRLQANPRMSFYGGDYEHPEQYFNITHGLLWSGRGIIDPVTGNYTKFYFPGDPYTGIGWSVKNWPPHDSVPAPPEDIRHFGHLIMPSGPVTLAPFDTMEIAIAVLPALGSNYLQSVEELKKRAKIIIKAYETNFNLVPSPEKPVISYLPEEDKITLWWTHNAEGYIQDDPYLIGLHYDDSTYRFEGYQVWQYRDDKGSDPKVIAVYDKPDGISVIEDLKNVNGVNVKVPLIFGNDLGLKRYITIQKDVYTGQTLRNGNPYYFGVTAYAYSRNSSPVFVESEKNIITVIPGRDKIDYSSKYNRGSEILVDVLSGKSSGNVVAKIIDPHFITGDKYRLEIYDDPDYGEDSVCYRLIDQNTNKLLFSKNRDFTSDTLYKIVTDGFISIVTNRDREIMRDKNKTGGKSGIDSVSEVKSSGKDITPVDVYKKLNSTGKWMIKTGGQPGWGIHNIDVYRNIPRNNYEIRFTPEGSEYYVSGEARPGDLLLNDTKGEGRVPFEIWDITDNKRLIIKITDRTIRDSSWSQNLTNHDWEAIAGYYGNYSDILPDTSGTLTKEMFPVGQIIISGEIPEPGTVIRIDALKPLRDGDAYLIEPQKANFQNTEKGKDLVEQITVFPNPYYGSSEIESGGQRFMRFTGLPFDCTIKIFSIAGTFIKRLDKSERSPYIDWDLTNEHGEKAASGIYVAYLEMPGVGTKIMKLAVIMGKDYLNRY